MNIGINVSRLSGQRTGVGRYIEYMLQHWSDMLLPDEEVHAYLPESVEPKSLHHLNLSEKIKLKVVRSRLPALFWENCGMAWAARSDDVFFGPSYSLPLLLKPRRRVVATHSVYEDANWRYNLTYGQRDEYSARSADAVIVPCDSTGDLVARHYGIPRRRLFSVPQGAPSSFRPLDDPALSRQTRIDLLGADVPFIIFVGKLSSRRNIPNLIAGFAKAKKAQGLPHKLLLFGPNHVDLPLAEICRAHQISGDVVQTPGKVSAHEDLIRIYNAAELFVQPSWYEGWSLTTVEALACGLPVIASNRGGLGDVARGYAYMLEDATVEAISDALITVLSDERLKQELRGLARQRGRALTWERTTGETLEIIRSVARG